MKNLIYCFYFPDSEKMYFGQTQNFWHRMGSYRASMKSDILKTNQPKLYNAINNYDYKFTIAVVAIDIDVSDLDDAEISYIEMFDSFKNGYNATGGGKVLRGEAHPMFGKFHTDAAKAQQSASRMGDPRPKSEEWCQEHSERMKGESNPNFGGLTDEHKQKVQITMLAKSVQKYKDIGIDVSEENINKVLLKNNGNMLQTSKEIGCTSQLIRRHCVRNNMIQISD
jgi:group I intron endonuclease